MLYDNFDKQCAAMAEAWARGDTVAAEGWAALAWYGYQEELAGTCPPPREGEESD